MSDFSLKKTRKIIVASIVSVVLSFIIADTISVAGFYHRDFDFNDIEWGIFFLFASPDRIYWGYDWSKKGI